MPYDPMITKSSLATDWAVVGFFKSVLGKKKKNEQVNVSHYSSVTGQDRLGNNANDPNYWGRLKSSKNERDNIVSTLIADNWDGVPRNPDGTPKT